MMRRITIATLATAWLVAPEAVDAQRGTIRGAVTVPNAGITGVVVYLIPVAAPGSPVPRPVTAAIDQRDLGFTPRVVAVTPGSTVTFSNSDLVLHNVFNPLRRGDGFDLGTWPPGESRDFTFAREGAYVILCHVHPEMVGYVVVVAAPYRAVADDQGQFRLDSVAAGSYLLRTWHRRLKTQEVNVTVAEARAVRIEVPLRFGRATEPKVHP